MNTEQREKLNQLISIQKEERIKLENSLAKKLKELKSRTNNSNKNHLKFILKCIGISIVLSFMLASNYGSPHCRESEYTTIGGSQCVEYDDTSGFEVSNEQRLDRFELYLLLSTPTILLIGWFVKKDE